MASSIPGCARVISGRGTGLTPGLGSMPSTGTNHGWRIAEGPKWGGRAARKRHGRGEFLTSDSRAVRCATEDCCRGRRQETAPLGRGGSSGVRLLPHGRGQV